MKEYICYITGDIYLLILSFLPCINLTFLQFTLLCDCTYTNKLAFVSGNKIKSLPQSNQSNTTERIWRYQKVCLYCPKYWLTYFCFWFFTLLVLLTFLWLHIKLFVHRHFILLKLLFWNLLCFLAHFNQATI